MKLAAITVAALTLGYLTDIAIAQTPAAPAKSEPAKQSATTQPPMAGAPQNKSDCLKLLRSFNEHVDEGKASPDAIAKAKAMGRAMTTYCNTAKFNEALALYKQIAEVLGKK